MNLSEFDFDLDPALIAQDPVSPRDACKMMHLNRKDETIKHEQFFDLLDCLNDGDVLVLNSSKVIPARILFSFDSSETGSEHRREMEIFLLNKLSDGNYECLVRPGKHFKPEREFVLSENAMARVVSKDEAGTVSLLFSDKDGNPLEDEGIFALGKTPLPPYIKNSHSSPDDYQTVYAREAVSVAAPTAGLHFTQNLLAKLKDKGVQIVEVLLHVNRGTFLPVKTEKIEDHEMHSEFFVLSDENAALLNVAKTSAKRIIAVGTTSVRVLESSFKDGQFIPQSSETSIYIYPGYEWHCVDALITNFHLPKSSLLLLVSSFAGRDFVMNAYEEAKKEGYRFYSFGDAMFIE